MHFPSPLSPKGAEGGQNIGAVRAFSPLPIGGEGPGVRGQRHGGANQPSSESDAAILGPSPLPCNRRILLCFIKQPAI